MNQIHEHLLPRELMMWRNDLLFRTVCCSTEQLGAIDLASNFIQAQHDCPNENQTEWRRVWESPKDLVVIRLSKASVFPPLWLSYFLLPAYLLTCLLKSSTVLCWSASHSKTAFFVHRPCHTYVRTDRTPVYVESCNKGWLAGLFCSHNCWNSCHKERDIFCSSAFRS